jgi:carbamoyl-phosphate synthase large subunit
VVVPPIGDDRYLRTVLEVIERHDIDAVLALSDLDLAVLPALRPELERRGVVALFPDTRRATISLDKLETARFLTGSGLVTPPTTDEFAVALAWGPPWFVKPRHGSASVGATAVDAEDDLHQVLTGRADMIAQPLVEGPEVNVEVCCDLAGQPVRACVWRKHESRRGETLRAETIRHDAALAAGLELARALGAPGPIDIDMILVHDRPVVIEINARFGGGYPVSHLAGAGFIRALIDMAAGRTVLPDYAYRTGLVMMKELTPFVATGTPADDVVDHTARDRSATW